MKVFEILINTECYQNGNPDDIKASIPEGILKLQKEANRTKKNADIKLIICDKVFAVTLVPYGPHYIGGDATMRFILITDGPEIGYIVIRKFHGHSIKVKYFNDKVQKLEKITKGNWIDLRAAENITMKAGEYRLIPLGIGMELPKGYEAHVVPRSSTFKNYGIIQTNHQGVIDGPDRLTGEGGYCGNNDQWFMPAYAIRDTEIHLNDRICQFRIMEQQPELEFVEVDELTGADRGGHGSTGKN